jgi:hypothetical protein
MIGRALDSEDDYQRVFFAVPSSLCHDFVVHSFLPQNFMMPSDITRPQRDRFWSGILKDMTFKIDHFGCVMPPRRSTSSGPTRVLLKTLERGN